MNDATTILPVLISLHDDLFENKKSNSTQINVILMPMWRVRNEQFLLKGTLECTFVLYSIS